jgi:hypothetical protein
MWSFPIHAQLSNYFDRSTKVFHSESTFTCVPCLDEDKTPTDQDATNIDHIATVDMAFTLGPVRDGIMLNHQLSPIPIHSNPYSPLQNLNDEIIYRQCMQIFLTPVSSPTRTLPYERKKQKNKNQTKQPHRSPGYFTTPRVIPESPEPKDKSIITYNYLTS